ncbi:Putative polysaccharide biosynthesis protein with aminopeptidase-like domain protein [Fundidesulfovibrio magnetotacticus]|uniref:Polysaccharide biosynthesis protein with aminopeptidase-like domain protein n=1 Tax=Fundidesulfovibrio magnetotacticus TaxID=2730080 RepID=A0A6V8LSZ2_9BACT|nr:DUF4910 domain-containing protein [Fundidesulfovibrio magnetotacticus]GFK94854.1 Putative polysaccharide biosynthesis protein with aminopeptidase-like domain protein [Fundidesulfovibrio magnetotacticus]
MTESARRMIELTRQLSPLPRLLVSRGLDRAFELLQEHFPDMVVHAWASGEAREDWVAPLSWNLVRGELRHVDGGLIYSSVEHPLLVVPYSQPFSGLVSGEELAAHASTRPDRPHAFCLEHRLAYNYRLKDWRLSLPHDFLSNLPEGPFHVLIETEVEPGTLRVGELFLPGESDAVVCFSAHIDELCNDDLSGCVVGLELFRWLSGRKRKHSYQLLLFPELFGALFWAYDNRGILARTVGMLNLEALGAGERLCMKRSLSGDSDVDNALRLALREENAALNELGFFEGYGNDERVFMWPGVNVPSPALQRFPFPEYHTSDDVPDLLSPEMMDNALRVCRHFVGILEDDAVPAFTGMLPPWLTKWGLYYDQTQEKHMAGKFNNELLFSVDGVNSLAELASLTGLRFSAVKDYLDKFVQHGLMTYSPKPPTQGRRA